MSPAISWLVVGAALALSFAVMLAVPRLIASWSHRVDAAVTAALETIDPDEPVDVADDHVDVDAPIPYSLTSFGELACEVLTPGPMSDAEWDAYLADTPPELRPRWTPGDDAAVRRLLDEDAAS